MNVYQIGYSYASSIADEINAGFADRGDVYQLAAEEIGECEYVIYPPLSHDLVRHLTVDQRREAEQMVESMSDGSYTTYDDLASNIAYWALRDIVADCVTEIVGEPA